MRVLEATVEDSAPWDAFVRSSPTGSFLQSWAWGEFQRAAGFTVTRLAVSGPGDTSAGVSAPLRAVCLLVCRPLPFNRSFLYAPWGPALASADLSADGGAALRAIAAAVRERLPSTGVFARIEPRFPPTPEAHALLREAGFTAPGRSIQPRDTLIINLLPSEDELLRRMHPKTRYNLRLARRHGVVVEERNNDVGLKAFLAFARDAERRGAFRYHHEAYYRAMLATLAPAGLLTILLARYRGTVVAAHLLVHFGETVTYAHGASSTQHRSVMAPYLLQWEGILRARAQGAKRYDLFGIAPKGSSVTHPWSGITRFKRGFGGAEEHTLGAMDLVADPTWYRLYEVGRSLWTLFRR